MLRNMIVNFWKIIVWYIEYGNVEGECYWEVEF